MDAKLDGVEMKRTRHINSRRLPERPHGQAGIDQDNTEQQETSIYRLWTLPEGIDPQTGRKRKLSDKFIIKFCGNIGGTDPLCYAYVIGNGNYSL